MNDRNGCNVGRPTVKSLVADVIALLQAAAYVVGLCLVTIDRTRRLQPLLQLGWEFAQHSRSG